ncbi:hypothetical protein B0H12DRAFT_1111048 [Mycena haematopus]|nr:hypothetical protein B0H12DRAFT_1111048 [Mycena haematopus]
MQLHTTLYTKSRNATSSQECNTASVLGWAGFTPKVEVTASAPTVGPMLPATDTDKRRATLRHLLSGHTLPATDERQATPR